MKETTPTFELERAAGDAITRRARERTACYFVTCRLIGCSPEAKRERVYREALEELLRDDDRAAARDEYDLRTARNYANLYTSRD